MVRLQNRIIEEIRQIREDSEHGANWLSNAAVELLADASRNLEAPDAEALMEKIRFYARLLIESRPSMASMASKIATFLAALPEDASVDELRDSAETAASDMLDSVADKRRLLVEHALSVLGVASTVFTCSSSSTVYDILTRMNSPRVFVTESRPMLEGRDLAEKLGWEGLDVTLVVDAAIGSYIGEADAALTGADSVQYDGSSVNKVGTRLLALAARDQGVPFYVACDSYKFNLLHYMGREILIEEQEPDEVSEPMTGVTVLNPYFEIVPARLVDGVITEYGLMTPTAIRRHLEEMKASLEHILVEP